MLLLFLPLKLISKDLGKKISYFLMMRFTNINNKIILRIYKQDKVSYILAASIYSLM